MKEFEISIRANLGGSPPKELPIVSPKFLLGQSIKTLKTERVDQIGNLGLDISKAYCNNISDWKRNHKTNKRIKITAPSTTHNILNQPRQDDER